MFTANRLDTLQLDEDALIHEHVGNVGSDGLALVAHGQLDLTLEWDATHPELNAQRALVDLLEKPAAKLVTDLEGTADDLAA